jgi:hypothetical protein
MMKATRLLVLKPQVKGGAGHNQEMILRKNQDKTIK